VAERERPQPELAETAWLLTRATATLVLGRMREIEEQVIDAENRWATLRTVLERFAATERPGQGDGP
jgi:hypothetical protein